ncbi:hypothetical protein T12_5365 [Trichinella patagoniensis]|uniref:Uncharacterized protein n=1 Tax=Trichinella patagoniensis TaxID=990121 RepID=A0A0V0YSZ2_9BILA|nr:hypothetical protein T12_5365 [Trichinella patagoniensis]
MSGSDGATDSRRANSVAPTAWGRWTVLAAMWRRSSREGDSTLRATLARQCVRVAVGSTGPVEHVEIVLSQLFEPAGNLPLRFFEVA